MGLVVLELLLNFGRNLIAILFAGITYHTHTAKRIARALERLVGLKADNHFIVLIKIARTECRDSNNVFGVDIAYTALFTLLNKQLVKLFT